MRTLPLRAYMIAGRVGQRRVHHLRWSIERARKGRGNQKIQNTTIYARLTTATLDAQARTIFVRHRVV